MVRPVLATGCGSPAVDVGEGGWVDLHRTDSAAMAEELAAMDVVARLRVVSDLVDIDPQGAAPYCSLLPHSTGRERCESASESAHLWEPPEDLEPATRAGRGLSRSMLTARDVPTSDWTQVKMAPPTDVADPQAQAWSRAREMAEEGSLHQVAQACAQLRGGGALATRLLHDSGSLASPAPRQSRRIRGLRAVWRIGRVPGHVCLPVHRCTGCRESPGGRWGHAELGACSHAGS